MFNSPKWPWIGCAISLLVFAFNAQQMGSIEKEAMPYFREMNRMQTGNYATAANTEAFLRGFFYGDAFGKAYEEQAKGQNLQIIMAGFESRYSSAKTWRNIAFWCALGFGVAWFGTHRSGPARAAG